MQKFSDDVSLGEMRCDDFFDAMVIEVAITDRTWPHGHVGTVVTAPLAAAWAYFAGCCELVLIECVHQCGA